MEINIDLIQWDMNSVNNEMTNEVTIPYHDMKNFYIGLGLAISSSGFIG